MHERKRKIRPARFVERVFFQGHVRFFRHFLARHAGDFPHLANSVRHLHKLAVQFHRFHNQAPPFRQSGCRSRFFIQFRRRAFLVFRRRTIKKTPVSRCSLETGDSFVIIPRYHSSCAFKKRLSSGSNKPFAFTRQLRKSLLAFVLWRFRLGRDGTFEVVSPPGFHHPRLSIGGRLRPSSS